MADQWTEVSVNGEFRKVPAIIMDGVTIITTGRRLKAATIKDEWWLDADAIGDPSRFVDRLKKDPRGADLFVFSQKPPDTEPRRKFRMAWSNVAAVPITTYEDWWEKRVTQVTRKNVRRALRRGVSVRKVEFDDRLVEAIVRINDSTPVKQQRRNVHYGKSFEAVKRDYTDFGGRSDYWGAFFNDEMIGVLRMIYQGPLGNIMQLFCMPQHNDKRPANILLTAAVEQCVRSGLKYLLYGQYIYGRNAKAPLTEFKRRNGFEQILVPTYYVPLTVKGRMAIMLNMHRGIQFFVPQKVMDWAFAFRDWKHGRKNRKTGGDDSE
jgi:hypothetical protein